MRSTICVTDQQGKQVEKCQKFNNSSLKSYFEKIKMPIQALCSVSIGSEEENAKKQLLDRIQNEVYKKSIVNQNEDSDDDFMALEESSDKERLQSLEEYRRIAEQTREVKLERLIQVDTCLIDDFKF